MPDIVFDYSPLERQAEFHRAKEMFKLYGGAMGGGKSVAICAEAIQLGIECPGNQILISRKTMKDLKRTTMVTFFDLLPHELVKYRNRSDGIVDLHNGTQFLFSDLEQTDKLKSLNLGAFAIDEATEASEEIFLMLRSRLRRKLPGISYHGLMATNPEPGWVKDRFISKQKPDHIFISALPRDNFHLPSGYVEGLERDFPTVWRQKYLEGSWENFGSQIFDPTWLKRSDQNIEYAVKYMAVDPAISEKDDADETAITCMGVGYDNLIHEVETIHGRWSFNEQIRQIESMYARHNPELIGIEMVAYQKALYDALKDKGFPVSPMQADRDKIRRAISISNLFERGLVRINYDDTRRQLIEFPKGSHDDLVDVIVYCLKMVRDYANAHYDKPVDELAHLDGTSKEFWRNHHEQKRGRVESFSDFYSKIL